MPMSAKRLDIKTIDNRVIRGAVDRYGAFCAEADLAYRSGNFSGFEHEHPEWDRAIDGPFPFEEIGDALFGDLDIEDRFEVVQRVLTALAIAAVPSVELAVQLASRTLNNEEPGLNKDVCDIEVRNLAMRLVADAIWRRPTIPDRFTRDMARP